MLIFLKDMRRATTENWFNNQDLMPARPPVCPSVKSTKFKRLRLCCRPTLLGGSLHGYMLHIWFLDQGRKRMWTWVYACVLRIWEHERSLRVSNDAILGRCWKVCSFDYEEGPRGRTCSVWDVFLSQSDLNQFMCRQVSLPLLSLASLHGTVRSQINF